MNSNLILALERDIESLNFIAAQAKALSADTGQMPDSQGTVQERFAAAIERAEESWILLIEAAKPGLTAKMAARWIPPTPVPPEPETPVSANPKKIETVPSLIGTMGNAHNLPPVIQTAICPNCGAPVTGQTCSRCGVSFGDFRLPKF